MCCYLKHVKYICKSSATHLLVTGVLVYLQNTHILVTGILVYFQIYILVVKHYLLENTVPLKSTNFLISSYCFLCFVFPPTIYDWKERRNKDTVLGSRLSYLLKDTVTLKITKLLKDTIPLKRTN